jgi:hypothetical protein
MVEEKSDMLFACLIEKIKTLPAETRFEFAVAWGSPEYLWAGTFHRENVGMDK